MTSKPSPIQYWYDAVARNDRNHIESLPADDAVFLSPAVHTPQQGKTQMSKYLRAAMVVLKNSSFRFVDEWLSARSAVLEFEAERDGICHNGIDLIRWSEAGQITIFKVMARPFKGLSAVIALMGEQLKEAGA
jgi:hypothetical protein